MGKIITSKVLSLSDHDRVWIILDFSNFRDISQVKETYFECLTKLADEKLFVVLERVFGNQAIFPTLSGLKGRLISQRKINPYPSNYILTHHTEQNSVTGIFILAIRKKSDAVEIKPVYSVNREEVAGQYLKTEENNLLFLMGSSSEKNSIDKQITQVFDDFHHQANNFQFSEKNLIRTWFFLGNIGQNYEEFNCCRNLFYQKHQVDLSAFSSTLPASTCVGQQIKTGRLDAEAWFYKSSKHALKISRIYNPFQKEPDGENYQYKPAFSRALLIETNEYRELQLSGTASIGKRGESLYPDDVYHQIITTFMHVKEILKQAEMDFTDFYLSMSYLKNPEYLAIFQKAVSELNIDLPGNLIVFTDICRRELKFEFDGVAFKKISHE